MHPGYLSQQSLLGEHSEIHALICIMVDRKSGYSHHPEVCRWKGYLWALQYRHRIVVKEMHLRGINHQSPFIFERLLEKEGHFPAYLDSPVTQFILLRGKYHFKHQQGRIPIPKKGTDFWAHHKYSVMTRGYQYYHDMQKFLKGRQVKPIEQDHELVEKIQDDMKKAITKNALSNTLMHLWGYFKKKANDEEKNHFFFLSSSQDKIAYLFQLSQKYQCVYLLHSTLFADIYP